jgi:hypothetical protein
MEYLLWVIMMGLDTGDKWAIKGLISRALPRESVKDKIPLLNAHVDTFLKTQAMLPEIQEIYEHEGQRRSRFLHAAIEEHQTKLGVGVPIFPVGDEYRYMWREGVHFGWDFRGLIICDYSLW